MSNETSRPLDLSLFGEDHVHRYRETGGEVGYIWNGVPTLIVTTTGRRSGKAYDTPIICGDIDGHHVIIASAGGAPTHPQWYLNLQANPDVQVQVKHDRFAATARTAVGAEREHLWREMNALWPSFDVYQTRTTREIPVVVLERKSQ